MGCKKKKKVLTAQLHSAQILCMFALWPDFHNSCSESGTKAMQTVHTDKQCYQRMQSILSESPRVFYTELH